MSSAVFLPVYRAAARGLAPFSGVFLWRRGRNGKEDIKRIGERRGRASQPRPQGRLAWLHGASVGEGLALLPLVGRLIAKGFHVLVTTGTVTSARILAQRLPEGATHQFAPLDAPAFIERFLDHWRPDLFILAESEIWPNTICAVHARNIPITLVNARLSPRSFERWRRLPGFISALLGKIDLCLAQSRDDAARLLQLGAPRVDAIGNLKYDVDAPPADPARLDELARQIGPRPIWIAASTHPGEEALAFQAHKALAARFPRLLTVLAPRHPHRGPDIVAEAEAAGLEAALRSRGEPIRPSTQVYVGDTIGELGLFYRLSSVIFMGKSLAGEGGQNPIEPAKLGSAILHGPHIGNFLDVYGALDSQGGAIRVADANALARQLEALFTDPALLRRTAEESRRIVGELGGATDKIMLALEHYIAHMIVSRPEAF
ncbi:3-deoxy-D-manno-octulosonic acid transferase [Rhodoblastus acidophilus]|uniref:3-deoxy-D-manno-octulosonic acid transferase n=1 Tax=Candidatus Rhodoblastus alkanivorans TaxID=2954117 RepID=A0ABS9Z4L5_9HYPH|nr:3-deoxy-D-manno-octulosonic acid transferase [Candidatus Rhodoblastus alkanivorans]MCI4677690.1 3-deoxy-D-manno-octulosonic acid transferase [Candidatus Rhodoblastus alkanivorans]MCI4682578.1 3-deoxy-D-manno-octulosonic acid transferase [Candidatus Rhodoblastus alkanivorans]MDI4639884.1 3-deoxy-D-manno-octulosonic acid transferase [Rhodoblastus acidophilus]